MDEIKIGNELESAERDQAIFSLMNHESRGWPFGVDVVVALAWKTIDSQVCTFNLRPSTSAESDFVIADWAANVLW